MSLERRRQSRRSAHPGYQSYSQPHSTPESLHPPRPIPHIVVVFPDGSVTWDAPREFETEFEDETDAVFPALRSNQARMTYRYQRYANGDDRELDGEQTGVVKWFAAGLAIAAFGLGMGAIATTLKPSPAVLACPQALPFELQRYSTNPTAADPQSDQSDQSDRDL
jgi:hypothetical protein